MHKNPFFQFKEWQKNANVKDPTACALATATKNGLPSVRMVLIKSVTEAGFTFYTNLKSKKACQIEENKNVALLFYWCDKQVRIEGCASLVAKKEADDYFAARPQKSQIVSMLSRQSSVLKSQEEFLLKIKEYEKRLNGASIKRPDYWHGFRVSANYIEFWQDGKNRCHTRFAYTLKDDKSWDIEMLYP